MHKDFFINIKDKTVLDKEEETLLNQARMM